MDSIITDERLRSLEQRLERIENALGVNRAPAQPEPVIEPLYSRPASVAPVIAEAQAAAIPRRSMNWLGIVAVLCFVLAAAFMVKLTLESGWLTPARQLIIATMFGFALIGAGTIFMSRDRAYASYLPAAGIIVLYLTAFAAYRIHNLLSFETALIATAAVSGFCLWLYSKIQNDVYAITAAVGTYVAPLLLGYGTNAEFVVNYYVICSVAFATIAAWFESRLLAIVASYLAIGLTRFVGGALSAELLATAFALEFFFFVVATFLQTRRSRNALSESEAWAFLPVLLLFYAFEYQQLDKLLPGWAPWISIGFAAIVLGLYFLASKTSSVGKLASGSAVWAFVTVVAFHSVYMELLPDEVRPWLFTAIMLIFAFWPARFAAKGVSDVPFFPAAALLIVLVAEYFTILSRLWNSTEEFWLIVSGASFAAMWIAITVGNRKATRLKELNLALLGSAHILAILGLYRLTHEFGSLEVSAVWLVYAVAVILVAMVLKDSTMAKSAMLVLALAAGKALLYDAASAPTLVRVLCLVLTGAVLYGCGFLLRRISHWAK